MRKNIECSLSSRHVMNIIGQRKLKKKKKRPNILLESIPNPLLNLYYLSFVNE